MSTSYLIETLSQIQVEMKAPKGQTNAFGKYKYRSCEDILEAVKKEFEQYDPRPYVNISDEIVLIGDRYYVKATASINIEGASIKAIGYAREAATKKGMDDSQITGATSSYARKYALNGLFCIDDTKDADTMDNRKPEPKKTEVIDETFAAKLCDSMLATETMADLDAKWQQLEPHTLKKNKVTQVLCNTHYLNRKKALEG